MASSQDLITTDAQLLSSEAFKSAHEKYGKLASDEKIAATKEGLEAKTHKVSIASNAIEALEIIKSLIPNGAEVHNTASVSLNQVGFVDVLKTGNDGKWVNAHGKAIEDAAGDHGKLIANLRRAAASDYVVTTVDAVTESGELVVGDGSSTRVAAFAAAQNVIIVAGANKLVKTVDEAQDRQKSYVYPLESARCRKIYGWPGSVLSNSLTISSTITPGHFHVVIVKEHLGF